MLRWVAFWQTMTSYGRLQIFVKTFTEELWIFIFKPFHRLFSRPSFVLFARVVQNNVFKVWSIVQFCILCPSWKLTHRLTGKRDKKVATAPPNFSGAEYTSTAGQSHDCESIPDGADIPCILLYPLDRYSGSNTIHINRCGQWTFESLREPVKNVLADFVR